jgi:hypothetical protein
MKSITRLILCEHCRAKFPDNDMWYYCTLQNQKRPDVEPCTLHDYAICPLKGNDDKDIREGKRK